jgi:class 3 adenylate cyclase/predicted ATPase
MTVEVDTWASEKSDRQDEPATGSDLLRFEGLTLDLAGRTLSAIDGREITLTRAEFELLSALIRSRGRALSRNQCLDAIAGRRAEPFDRTVDVLISRLRRKIEPERKAPRLLLTVPGHGYKFAAKTVQVMANRHAPAPPVSAEETPSPVRATPAAERRLLTVMVCSLSVGTEPSVRLDPEERHGISTAFRTCYSDICGRHGGVPGPVAGDTVFIYFGFPVAHEHDAEQAIRAGLAVVAAMQRLDLGLAIRIGIATGVVVVGDVPGHEPALEPTVVGETPNLAARLQALAEPGAVVIDAATRRLTRGFFEYVDLEPASLRGFATPISASRVARESATASRFEALHLSALTPLVGREEELELLMRRWQRVKAGGGQVVLLSGEPGIGKSRLIVELEQRIAAETQVGLRYFCLPHYQDSPLRPIIARWEQAAGFARGDGSEEKLRKLEAMLLSGGTSAEDLALIADLLSVPTEGRYPKLEYSPQRKKEKLFEALNRWLAGLARTNRVLLLLEDAHWADASTLELLETTIDRLADLPVLLVISLRPEFSAPWIGRPGVSLIALSRLDRRESAALATRVMRDHTLPERLLDRIVTQTDGVPLFIEELTKAVLEAPVQPDGTTLAVPDTLQASLMARLDSLPAAKTVAQIGAVIGRSYAYELIDVIAGLPAPALQDALGQLVGSGLVFERGAPPDATYTFKHALVQEVAYNSLLRGRRAALHAQVVKVLCAGDPGIEEGRPDLLAYHCEKAGFVERAVEQYMRAGRQALRRSAYVEAHQLFSAASRLTPALPEGDARIEAELHALCGLSYSLQHGLGLGTSDYGRVAIRAADLCELLPNPLDFLRVLWSRWNFHLNRSDFTNALKESAHLMRLGEERGDVRGHIIGHIGAGITKHFLGEFVAARANLELAISMLESCEADPTVVWDPVRSFGRESILALARAHLARPVCFLGYPDQALAHASAAVEGFERLGDMGDVAHFCEQRLRLFATLWEQSELDRRVAEALRLCREYAMPYQTAVAKIFEGYAIARRGDLRAGGAAIRQGLADYEATGAVVGSAYYRALLAETYERQGDTDQALGILAEALSDVKRTGKRWGEAELTRRVGEVHRLKGNRDAAEYHFVQAIEIARGQSAKTFELCAAVSLARLWSEQGKRAEARELLAPIFGWFTEGFNLRDLKEAKALLDELTSTSTAISYCPTDPRNSATNRG